MDMEMALLTRLFETGDMKAVVKAKVDATFFTDESAQEIYLWSEQLYLKHGKVPSLEMVSSEFEGVFIPENTDDAIELILEQVKNKKLYNDIQVTLRDVARDVKTDSRKGLETLKDAANALAVAHSEAEDVDLTKRGQDLKLRYAELKEKKGLLGIPFPWPRFTKMTKGARKGHHIGFYGDTGSMKTWMIVYIATWMHMEQGVIPALFTRETMWEDLEFRVAAARAAVDYELLQDGMLPAEQQKRFFKCIDDFADHPPFPVLSIQSDGIHAVSEMRAKVKEYRADIALVDGLYLYATDLEWKTFGVVANAVRRTAEELAIPFITTNQANAENSGHSKRGNSGVSVAKDVSFGKSYAMSTTVLTRIIREPIHRDNNELVLWTKKVSEGRPCRIVIHAIPALNFSQKRELHDNEDEATAGVDISSVEEENIIDD